MKIIARRLDRCPYPPTGSYISRQPLDVKFSDIEIKPVKVERLKPDGVKQSQAEARIMSNIVAIKQNRAMGGGDILSR